MKFRSYLILSLHKVINGLFMSRPQELFLSHATCDREFATLLANHLRKHGIPVWYSRTEIRGSQEWQDEIGLSLERCDWFTVILSPASIRSMWVKREVANALEQRRLMTKIVPIMYKSCMPRKLSWVLSSIQRIDFSIDPKIGLKELLGLWGIGMKSKIF